MENGGIGRRYPILPDNLELIKKNLSEAAGECDMVIINAGSSAGRDDYTVHAIGQLGEVYTHGVSMKPGKPVILGKINSKPVIGLPGYPVSAYLTFMEFVTRCEQIYPPGGWKKNKKMFAKLSKTLMSGLKYEEYVRVKLGIVENELVASPLERGAGASMSLVRADGFALFPRIKREFQPMR